MNSIGARFGKISKNGEDILDLFDIYSILLDLFDIIDFIRYNGLFDINQFYFLFSKFNLTES